MCMEPRPDLVPVVPSSVDVSFARRAISAPPVSPWWRGRSPISV